MVIIPHIKDFSALRWLYVAVNDNLSDFSNFFVRNELYNASLSVVLEKTSDLNTFYNQL